jgi:uncharacterized Zn finger protein
MLYDLEPVSRWSVLNLGFKAYKTCTQCHSENILYFKVRTVSHKGFAPECGDCGRKFPVRLKLYKKTMFSSLQQSPIPESLFH